MKLRGTYNSAITYNVGDVVKYANGNVYHLISAAPAGTAPTETRFWGQVDQQHQKETAIFALDVLEIMEAAMNDVQDELTDAIEALEERVAALEPDTPSAES